MAESSIRNQHENSIQAICSPKRRVEERAGDKKPLLETEFESKQDYCSVEPTGNLGLTAGYKGPYFEDGQRSIDMVLVFQCKHAQNGVKDRKNRDTREKFINELITNGLEIEIERIQHFDTNIHFIKLHAPLVTLQRKAEDMKLKMPFSLLSKNPEMDVAIASLPFALRGENLADHNHRYFLLAPFVQRRAETFFAKGKCFSTLDRIAVVERILNETRFSEKKFGVKSLINQEVFRAVYPPHESGEDVSIKRKKGTRVL